MTHDEALKLLDELDDNDVGVEFYGTGQPEALLTALQAYFLSTTRAELMGIMAGLKKTDDVMSVASKLLDVVSKIDGELTEP